MSLKYRNPTWHEAIMFREKKIALALKSRVPWRAMILEKLTFQVPPWPADISIATESFYNFLWPFTYECLFACQDVEAEGHLRSTGYLYNKSILFWTIMKYLREEHLLDFSARMNHCEGINNGDITLSAWVFTVHHLLRGMGSESHLPQLLPQQNLQSQIRIRSGNTVQELSIGCVGFPDYYFLVVILLHVISSFTLNLLLFCEIFELWGMNACILLLYDWGGRMASWEPQLPTRRISVLKTLNSRAVCYSKAET